MTFRFCPLCGTLLSPTERGGRLRPTCRTCGFVHYQNPTAGVAVIVRKGDQVLLGRRAPTSSYAGQWCIPCGHVEADEDVRDAAVREFAEETGLSVRLGEVAAVHSNFHNPEQPTVGIWFYGVIESGEAEAADDLDRVQFFPLNDLPDSLAFPTDQIVLAQLQTNAA